MTKKENLQKIANTVMYIDHVGVQCDDIHECEKMHQVILEIDKLDKHEAIRLLVHIIHAQQLLLAGADINLDKTNPFKNMVSFDCIEDYVRGYSPNVGTLY